MRPKVAPTLLALAAVAELVVLEVVGTAVTGAASARSPAPTQAPTRSDTSKRAMAPGRTGAKARTWSLRLAPAPDDLVLAQIRFPRVGRRAVARDLPHIEMQSPSGADYLAVATPRARVSSSEAQVLVLPVNRPSALEDPVSVKLRLSASGRLAEHEVRRAENPFAGTAAPAAPDLCDLATDGHALQAGGLTPLQSNGSALGAFDAAAAVAQAYDAACGLPYESAFKQIITGTSVQPQPRPPEPAPAPPEPTPAPPQPQPAPPAPAPVPPVGKLPGEGCVPTPGYACPAALQSPLAARHAPHRPASGRRRLIELSSRPTRSPATGDPPPT
jgi:hypothetical protein